MGKLVKVSFHSNVDEFKRIGAEAIKAQAIKAQAVKDYITSPHSTDVLCS